MNLNRFLISAVAAGCLGQDGAPKHFQPVGDYPAPMSNLGRWGTAAKKVDQFLASLSLEEKATIVTGTRGPCGGNTAPIRRINFTGLCFQDSPLGVREVDFNTVFPAGISAAASFDKDMIHRRGLYMGAEFRAKGIKIAFSPVAGPMGRSALGGRNWEAFSADPYLSGVAMEETVLGIQANGVQSCAKHWVGNEQETQRNPSRSPKPPFPALSSNIDDRTMHEIYMWPFANAVKAGVSYVMCSYNRLNQTYACENSKALNGLLKGELGFQGAVVSDYGATKSGVFGIKSGLDMDQPGGPNSLFGANLPIAVRNGSVPESRLDDMVRRVMTPYFFHGQDKDYPLLDPSTNEIRGDPLNATELLGFAIGGTKSRDVRADHGMFVRELGAASAVLLKNNGALPLKNPRNIGVFGNGAADLSEGLFEATFLKDSVGPDYGPMAQGGGSGSARLNYLVSPLEAIKSRSNGALVQYIVSNKQAADSIHTIYPIPEVCLVFLKTYAAEGFDRISLEVDWNGTAVVNTVARRCPNTIVVTHSPGINLMPWADNPNVTAIIAAHLPGQEIGNSIVDVLYGVVNPTGKLPYTIAYNQSDYNAPIVNVSSPTLGTDPWQADFKEGLLIDYRHFDAAKIKPRYEFGFGLSYSSFDLSAASVVAKSRRISERPPSTKKGAPGGNPALYSTLLTLQTTVVNTGQVDGAAVPQLYVSFPSSAPVGTPDRVLRGFSKTKILKQAEQQTMTFELHRRDVSFWDVVAQDWRIPNGEFTFLLGFSSRDIKKEVKVALI